mmetsp:Transcript_7237/g.10858  ORF Transcript_7237/g.10858 Transcript_7237/m.10858 type:complete len:226 (-) Transcript_7237:310-987(-)
MTFTGCCGLNSSGDYKMAASIEGNPASGPTGYSIYLSKRGRKKSFFSAMFRTSSNITPRIQRNAVSESSVFIERSWAMIKDWQNSADGKTYYEQMTEHFFDQIALLPQNVTDFFASNSAEQNEETHFDRLVYLVRMANEQSRRKSTLHRNNKKEDGQAYQLGRLGCWKGLKIEDFEHIERGFMAALRFVVCDFVSTDDKRATIVNAWNTSLDLVITRMLRAFPKK